jgi:Replication-relaxation
MSAYLGRSGLEQLRRSLSDRDLRLLHSVNEHRFLTTAQIRALHFVSGTTEGAERTCRRALTRLSRDRVLSRLQRRVGGVRAGSASFVYSVGPVGRRLLDEARRTTEPSALFLEHTLAVADVRVLLETAERSGAIELLRVEIEPTSWRRFVGPGGARDIVKPDLYVLTAAGDYEDAWFIEVDRGTESPAAIARKCHAYDRYWRSGREQAAQGSFPITIWVCPDERRRSRIRRIIGGARNLNRSLFRVTTGSRLLGLLSGGAA